LLSLPVLSVNAAVGGVYASSVLMLSSAYNMADFPFYAKDSKTGLGLRPSEYE
jgi:hypothetical protein